MDKFPPPCKEKDMEEWAQASEHSYFLFRFCVSVGAGEEAAYWLKHQVQDPSTWAMITVIGTAKTIQGIAKWKDFLAL